MKFDLSCNNPPTARAIGGLTWFSQPFGHLLLSWPCRPLPACSVSWVASSQRSVNRPSVYIAIAAKVLARFI